MLSGKIPSLGKFDRRIIIMEPIITDGDSNEDKLGGYEVIGTDPRPYARVENATGDTIVEGHQTRHTQPTVFTVRYRTDLTIKNKVVNEGKMYSILSVIEEGEHRRRFTKISGEYLQDYVIT